MNKGKYFSAALFKENIRRFWPLAAVGFFIYFMSAPFALLQRMGVKGLSRIFYGFSSMEYYLNMLLKNQNVGFEFVHLVLPVVSAVAVFGYLNKVNSVGVVHSLPFSKRVLFITNYASGLTISFVPFVINWIIVFLMKGMFNAAIYKFTYGMFFRWLLASFTIIIFVFSIAVLACIVSGNGVIATLTGFAFNFLVPAVMLCFYGYAAKFLTGFNGDGIWETVMKTNPWMRTLSDGGLLVGLCIIYIVIAVIVAVAAYVLYHTRQLERCGDSYVFGWMQTVISFLFVFVISTMTGLVLFDGLGITAYIIGFIIGFLLGQMISLKTLHIFNRNGLRNLIVFAVIMALILAGFALDITGFQKRVPKSENVQKAEVTTRFTSSYYDTRTIKDPGTLKYVEGVHREIVENLDKIRESDQAEEYTPYNYSETEEFSVVYTLSSGRKIYRSYSVPKDLLEASRNYKDLRNSQEILSSVEDLKDLHASDMKRSVIMLYINQEPTETSDGITWSGRDLGLTEDEIDILLNAYADDIKDDIAKGSVGASPVLCAMELRCMTNNTPAQELQKRYEDVFGFRGVELSVDGEDIITVFFELDVAENHSRTIQFLKSKGVINTGGSMI